MKHICKNCRLFNSAENVCGVNVVIQGESYELPVLPSDTCHWERIDKEVNQLLEKELEQVKALPPEERQYFQPTLEAEKDHAIEVKQIRMWSDGKNGYVETQE